jgi:hypothetical protein
MSNATMQRPAALRTPTTKQLLGLVLLECQL